MKSRQWAAGSPDPSLPRWMILVIGITLIGILGFLDQKAPSRMSLTLLYLTVCMAAAWLGGAACGLILSVLAAGTIWIVEHNLPEIYTWAVTWNLGYRIIVFGGVCWITSKATRLNRELNDLVRRQSERTSHILETAQDGFILLDPEMKIRDVNPSMCGMIGCTRDQLVGLHIQDLRDALKPQELDEVTAKLKSDHGARFETHLRSASGSVFQVEVTISSPPSAHGMSYCFIRDITRSKHHERSLQIQRDVASRLSLAKDIQTALNSLLEVAATVEGIDCGGVYLANPDAKLVQLHANHGLSEDFVRAVALYPANSMQGTMVLAGQTLYLSYKELAEWKSPEVKSEGLRSLAVIPLQHEGQVLGCLNLASHVLDVIPDGSKDLLELLGAQAAGIIARMRTEQALKTTEGRLRMLVSNAPVVLFAADRNATITVHEGRALSALGWRPNEQVGKNARELFKDNPSTLRGIDRVLSGEELFNLEKVGEQTFEVLYAPLKNGLGVVEGFIGVATNITDRLQLEGELLEVSDREQARIGQEIHDGLCQQLISLAFDARTLQEQLHNNKTADSHVAARLVKHLDVAITESRRLSEGLFPIRLETEGLGPALEKMLRAISNRFGISCVFRIDPVRTQSSQVATNIYRIAQEAFNNLIKHSGATSAVLELRARKGQIELRVEDNGRGVPRKRNGNSGMGLHIMKYRARLLGTDLVIKPRDGGGTIISCLVNCGRMD